MSTIDKDIRSLGRLRTALLTGDIDRRAFLSGAMGLSAAALLAGCGGGLQNKTGDGGGTKAAGGKSVVPLYTSENDPATLAFFNMAIAEFTKKHPDVQVKVTSYSDSNQLQYLTTAFKNGVDVGIFSPAVSDFALYQQAGYLAQLDSVVAEIGAKDFLPATRVQIDGHDYAMPQQSNSSLVYYRKDLLQGAGLSEPKTYQEYVDAITALNGKNGIVGIASGVGPTPQLPLQFFAPYIYQAGWDYFDKDGELTFDRPEVLEAVQRFVAVMRQTADSFYNTDFGGIVSAYSAGRAAFATFPGRLGLSLADKNPKVAEATGVMRIPAGPFMTGQLHFGSGQQYALYGKTADLEAAKAFLMHMTTGKTAVAFAMTVPGHLLPPLRSTSKLFMEEVEHSTDPYVSKHRDWIKTFVDAVPGAMTSSVSMGAVSKRKFLGKFSNSCPWASEIWPAPPIDGAMFQDILVNKQPAEKAWRAACAKMKSAADTWKQKHPSWKPSIG